MSEVLRITIQGMDCASCAVNIERRLNKLKGVEKAQVNYASEEAELQIDPSKVGLNDVVRVVKSLGYGATAIGLPSGVIEPAPSRKRTYSLMEIQLLVGAFLTILLLIGSMLPFAPEFLMGMRMQW